MGLKPPVIIADDNSFIREGMRIILSTFSEFEVLATVMDGQEAVKYRGSQFMKDIRIRMEGWIICLKAILLIYVISL